jgi:hypothetical protein
MPGFSRHRGLVPVAHIYLYICQDTISGQVQRLPGMTVGGFPLLRYFPKQFP